MHSRFAQQLRQQSARSDANPVAPQPRSIEVHWLKFFERPNRATGRASRRPMGLYFSPARPELLRQSASPLRLLNDIEVDQIDAVSGKRVFAETRSVRHHISMGERTGLRSRTERQCRSHLRPLGPSWIPPRWRCRHCGASVVTALDAVATERIRNVAQQNPHQN